MIYKIQHSFREVIVVPLQAIYPNVSWITDNKKKMVVTSDNVMAKVKEERFLHFLSEEMSEVVKEVYKTDVLTFGRKWFQSMNIGTMEFVFLRIEKYDGEYRENN